MVNKIIWFVLAILVLIFIYMFVFNEEEVEIPIQNRMSFFITSRNPGQGGNLGGLSGADGHCQLLAGAVGAGDLNWKAYLSQQATGSALQIDARDRIGSGPWYNQKGLLVANNVSELHLNNVISKEIAVDENGNTISGRGDAVNIHDILTGSNMDGTASTTPMDTTCGNWTLSSSTGSAIVGHHDRQGTSDTEAARSWNSSHASRGCGLPQLQSTGGGGLLYCFAAN